MTMEAPAIVEKKWYVVHTYSGYEHKVKAALEERIRSMGKGDYFGDILVPAEKVVVAVLRAIREGRHEVVWDQGEKDLVVR